MSIKYILLPKKLTETNQNELTTYLQPICNLFVATCNLFATFVMPCSGLLSGGLAESNLLLDGVGLLSIWVWLTFLLGSGLFLGGSALLYNWVWLSLGRFRGVELTCARILFLSYLDLPYFLLGSGLVLVGSGLASTWVWLTFERLGGKKISFGEVWLTFT